MEAEPRQAAVALYRPHHYLLYELTPGWRGRGGLSRHNSYGFRGEEFAISKPRGTYRVVCMGESTTYCTNIADDRLTYPARLEAALTETYPERSIEVLNAGVGGYTSAENLLHFIFKVQPVEPDLVVFYYTHNDVHPRRWPSLSRDYREYRTMWCQSALERTRLVQWLSRALRPDATLGAQVLRLREHLGRITYENVLRNPPVHFRANVRSLAILARGWGIDLLLVNPPYPHLESDDVDLDAIPLPARAVYEHRRVVEEIGAELGVPVYDLRADMPPPPEGKPEADAYYRDPVHVTERGAALMGRAIAGAVIRLGFLERVPAAG